MIIKQIIEKTGLSEADIEAKIKEKLKQLSGLISEDGAAIIVANQLGVKLSEQAEDLKIKDIAPGMRSVSIKGKAARVYEVRTFERENRKGKVGSFLLGDDSGVIRVVCWNDKANIFDKLKQGMSVAINTGYAREDRNGRAELHIADRGNIEITDDTVEEIKTNRKKIADLDDDEQSVEILGTIVQAFDPRFFEICPQCGKRARQREEGWHCDAHGKIEPAYSYVLNIFLDDGTENIRVVLWKSQVQRLIEKNDEEIVSMKDKSFEDIKNDLLGKIIKFNGRTTRNQMFNRLEFIAQQVFLNPDPDEELERVKSEKKQEQSKPVEEKEETPAEEEKKSSVIDDADDEDEEIISLDELESL